VVATTAAAREQAASAHTRLEEALDAHRGELGRRDRLAAAAAGAYEENVGQLSKELDEAQTALAAAHSRADAADHRAGEAENALRATVARSAETDALLGHLRAEVTGTQVAAARAEERARRAEALFDAAQVELRTERDCHDEPAWDPRRLLTLETRMEHGKHWSTKESAEVPRRIA